MTYVIDDQECIGCGTCQHACPNECMMPVGLQYMINDDFCTGCGACVLVCPVLAIKPKD